MHVYSVFPLCTLSPYFPVSTVHFSWVPFFSLVILLRSCHVGRWIDRSRFGKERKCSICVFLPHYCLLFLSPIRQFLFLTPWGFPFTFIPFMGKRYICLVVFALFNLTQWSLEALIFSEMAKSHSSLWLNKSPLCRYTTLAWKSEETVRTLFSTPHEWSTQASLLFFVCAHKP